MKRIILLMSVILVFAVASCNKDQQAVKTLDGKWEEVSIDNQAVPDSSKGTYTFESCKLKTEEYCSAFYTDADGDVLDYNFKVEDKGTKLAFQIVDPTFGEISITSTITELTNSKLILTLSFFGQTTVTEYKKL